MTLSKLAIRRLTKLADFMEQLPASANRHFDMADFLRHRGEHIHPINGDVMAKDLHTCGTTACALGWAATMPYFRRLGLSMNMYGDVKNDFEVFGLEWNECDHYEHLFGGALRRKVKTPKQWARHCRAYIKKHS